MARRGPKKKEKAYEPLEPGSLKAHAFDFAQWMAETHFSPHTVRKRGNALSFFIRFCDERGITRPAEINRAILERYRRQIYQYRNKDNQPLGITTQVQRLLAVRSFFKWLSRHHHILYNPANELELPRTEKRLPDRILTVQEIEQVINQTNVHDTLGLRDRAILETLYSTGIRRTELINIKLYDLSLEKGTVLIRLGKGRKDRVVPIGERALAWIDKYLLDVRPRFATEPDEGALFLTIDGEPLSGNRLSELVGTYLECVRGNRYGSCHLFRHACATHMLEAGADIRIIQAILGHENLSTTEVYTRVSIQHLKDVHTRTHPARLTRTPNENEASTTPDANVLITALAAETKEEGDDSDEPA